MPILHRECTFQLCSRIARICRFCQAVVSHFQHLAGPIIVSVDLIYDVLCLSVFVMAYLLESGKVTAGS